MNLLLGESYRVAIPISWDGNGIAEAIYGELKNLGHQPFCFPLKSAVDEQADAIILFGPFGKFLHIPEQYMHLPKSERPVLVYWNTEGLPDPRIPLKFAARASQIRSWISRVSLTQIEANGEQASRSTFEKLDSKLIRFRYLGDYLYAQMRGWVDVFADISAIYAKSFQSLGIPTITAPFGSFGEWYENMELERDIDVLWMGKRATKRRSNALDYIRTELGKHGVEVYMVDDVEHPFVHGPERTHLLNRTKITLNLLRTWYDENSLRICLAAPNRSLVVSEPLLPHVPQYVAGKHYVSATVEKIPETILEYLENEQERKRIAENAYELTTQSLTFRSSVEKIMDAVAIEKQIITDDRGSYFDSNYRSKRRNPTSIHNVGE
jgi:hypothetical protein